MVGYRFLIAGGILLVYLAIRRRPLLHGWPKALFLSVILWLLYASQTIGLNYTTASNSGFITGLFVVFVPIFLVTLFKRKPTVWEWIASVVSLAGLWVLTGGLRQINTGDALTLISAMTYALHLLYSDKYMKASADPLLISCQQFLLVGAISIVTCLITGRPFAVTSSAMGWVVFLAILPTLSAFVIQMFAQKLTSPLRVSLIFAFEPVFAAVFAWTFGGEQFVLKSALGGLFIFAGLVMSGIGAKDPTDGQIL
jgi:drug/metabolite transporter (DMT)-like permease